MSALVLRVTVHKLLEQAHRFDWTVQGPGMFRLNLSEEVRVHVWDPSSAVPNVTRIHTHPWDFVSTVLSGEMQDHLYIDRSQLASSMRSRWAIAPEVIRMAEHALARWSPL